MALSKPSKPNKTKHKQVDGHPCDGEEGDICDIRHKVAILGGQFIVSKCETCWVTFNREGAEKKEKIKKESKVKKSKRRRKPKKPKPDNLFTGYEGSL